MTVQLIALAVLTPGFCQAPDVTSGVVLTRVEGRHLFKQCSRHTPGLVSGYWTPSPQDVAGLESALPQYLRGMLPGHATRDSYYRQYAGFVRKGHRMIYVNALLKISIDRHNSLLKSEGRSLRLDWQHKAITVCDGGQSFFGIEYDPTTKKFSHLLFNGAA